MSTNAYDVATIGAALRGLRRSAGLLQVDVSRHSGLTRAMVSAYEAGKSAPSLGSLSAYLGALGRNLRDLQDELDRQAGAVVGDQAADSERAVGRAVLKVVNELFFTPHRDADDAAETTIATIPREEEQETP